MHRISEVDLRFGLFWLPFLIFWGSPWLHCGELCLRESPKQVQATAPKRCVWIFGGVVTHLDLADDLIGY